MKIKISGELTMSQARQALFEKLLELEERFGVRHSLSIAVYLRPSNGFGDEVTPVYPDGREVTVLYSKGPYRSVAEQYEA